MKNDTFSDRGRLNILISAGLTQTSSLHGQASAEFIKAFTGVDNEKGISFERGHHQISNYRINPDYAKNNIQQQAGYSAEVTHVARENASNILNGSPERISRTEDVAGYGNNHTVYDHVKTIDGKVIENSASQMKFVSNLEGQLKKIAEGKGGGKNDHSRYLQGDLTLPSDQVEKAKEICTQEAEGLRQQAKHLESQGKYDLAAQKKQSAKNYEDLRDSKIKSASLTTQEAIEYRQSTKWATTKDIARVSHKAGVQGAKFGAVLGGSISLLTNIVLVSIGNKEPEEAIKEVSLATGKSAVSGYAIGFSGSAISGFMHQSANVSVRSMAGTSFPTMIVTNCIQLSGSISSLVKGEINTIEFFEQVGQSGTNMLAAGAFATAGQLAIPIPIVGAMAGSMVGYALSSVFYQEALNSFKEAKLSEKRYNEIKQLCTAARVRMKEEANELRDFFAHEIERKSNSSVHLFSSLDNAIVNNNIDAFSAAINSFCAELGYDLAIKSKSDLDVLMASDKILKI